MKIKIPFTNKFLNISVEKTLYGELIDLMLNRWEDGRGNMHLNKIPAIKHYRSVIGITSLADAKNYVDNLAIKNNIPSVIYK